MNIKFLVIEGHGVMGRVVLMKKWVDSFHYLL